MNNVLQLHAYLMILRTKYVVGRDIVLIKHAFAIRVILEKFVNIIKMNVHKIGVMGMVIAYNQAVTV